MKKKVIHHSPNVTHPKSELKVGDFRPYALGHAAGMMSMIVLVFYGLFVWFSNYDPSFIIEQYPISFSFFDWTFLFGLLQSYVLFYVVTWVFAKFYNSL
ncbi:MAG: hypothetical protein ACP5NS_01450 [Candidatus Pacearchaeota archaeon]